MNLLGTDIIIIDFKDLSNKKHLQRQAALKFHPIKLFFFSDKKSFPVGVVE